MRFSCRDLQRCVVVVAAVGLLASLAAPSARGEGKAKPKVPPSFAQIKQVIEGHFQRLPDYEPGDLISQSKVEPLLEQLRRLGWTPANWNTILEAVPADDEYLVKTLGTRSGRKFMRRIAVYPGAYDRLERLSRLPHGKRTIQDLIRGPGGERMLEYLTTTPGGREMGKMLSQAPKGADFNKPTGRIYTVEMLLSAFERSCKAKR